MKTNIWVVIIFCLSILNISNQNLTPTVKMSVAENTVFGTKAEETCFGCGDCSIYCQLENKYKISASSYLQKKGRNAFDLSKIDDNNLQTAWFEGKLGDGIGEWFVFNFEKSNLSESSAAINGLYLFNGYRKSLKDWNENARIKKLLMSVNEQEFLILELADTYKQQSVDFEQIKLKDLKSIYFKILEVYKGKKYSDAGLSEIKFVGIHHH